MAAVRTIRGVAIPGDEVRGERPRRTFDEQLLVRFPALAYGLRALWARLPVRSRVRRALLVRIMQQGASAVNRRDFDVLFLGFDPEIEYVMPEGGTAFMPDLAERHCGHAAYRAVWQAILESFEDLRMEPEEVLDLGHTLVLSASYTGHGAGSGAPISQRLHQVFTLRNGVATKQRDFVDRADALDAAQA